MALSEFSLIKHYFTDIGRAHGAVALGIGDDCALLDATPGRQLAVSVDTLVADVHFPDAGDPYLIGQRALRVNLSDLAAMGATPLAFTLALTLPRADHDWLAQFSRGLGDCAAEFEVGLIGGNTTRGPQTVINIQILGLLPQGQALLRSGALPGDAIFVSGTLGDARAALDCLTLPSAQRRPEQEFFLQRYYQPTPRLSLGAALRGVARAAIDISDGFSADLGHILERSRVGAIIDTARLPLSPALRALPDAQQFALCGGDDYELCFTAPPERIADVEQIARQLSVPVTEVGVITADQNLLARDASGALTPLAPGGFQHF